MKPDMLLHLGETMLAMGRHSMRTVPNIFFPGSGK